MLGMREGWGDGSWGGKGFRGVGDGIVFKGGGGCVIVDWGWEWGC